jgi:hypothetical protein
MANRLRVGSNQISPPEIPKRSFMSAIQFVPDLDVEGRLVCSERGFLVLLNERLRRYGARARFTVAHELGHTLFYDLNVPKPRRRVPRTFNNAFEEHLCSNFAGELLIPFEYLSAVADGFQQKTEAEKTAILNEVASKCLVTREVAACHLVRTLGWWKSILIFTRGESSGPGILKSSALHSRRSRCLLGHDAHLMHLNRFRERKCNDRRWLGPALKLWLNCHFVDPGCPYNSQPNHRFKFFGPTGPIHRDSATPPSEKPKPRAGKIIPLLRRNSFSFI